MLLILRSKLWRSGGTGPPAISGSGAGTQNAQSNSGNCLWYSALTNKVAYFGTSLKKLIEGDDESILVPSIEGDGHSRQPEQRSDGHAALRFIGEADTAQQRQRTQAVAYQIPPVSGSGSTMQEVGWSHAQAEQIDVELEVFAAILAVV